MNNVQLSVLDYLRDGGDERQAALDMLTDRGFFVSSNNPTSLAEVGDFIDEVRGDGSFCDDGINRFAQAILGEVPKSGPREDEIVVTFRLDLTHNSGATPDDDEEGDISRIVMQLGQMLRLAKGESSNGEPWSIEGWQLDEWNWGVHT